MCTSRLEPALCYHGTIRGRHRLDARPHAAPFAPANVPIFDDPAGRASPANDASGATHADAALEGERRRSALLLHAWQTAADQLAAARETLLEEQHRHTGELNALLERYESLARDFAARTQALAREHARAAAELGRLQQLGAQQLQQHEQAMERCRLHEQAAEQYRQREQAAEHALAALREEVAWLRDCLQQAEGRTAAMTDELAVATARHEALVNSRAWRVTAPFRALGRLARRTFEPRGDRPAREDAAGR